MNNLNGMANIPPVSNNNMMIGMPSMAQANPLPPTSTNPMSMSQSIFDPMSSVPRMNATVPSSSSANLPPSTTVNSQNAIGPLNTSNTSNNSSGGRVPNDPSNFGASLNQSGNGVTTPTTINPGTFRPKPIEELLMPTHDKKTPPPLLAQQQQSSQPTPVSDQKPNMVHPFNKSMDKNLKNALSSSWSSLAATGSPQNTSSKSKPAVQMDAFQQFRNKAIEKADRLKQLEQQELKRSHKEAAEKRQQEQAKKREEAER